MTTIQIPLDKNADVAALLADKSPGDRVYGCFTVKDLTEQTATLRIEEMADDPSELPKPDDPKYADDGDDADESAPEKSPEGAEAETPEPAKRAGSMGRELAAKMNSSGDGY